MTLSALHADIAARYAKLNQSISKGSIKPAEAAVLSDRYAWLIKDAQGNSTGALGMSQMRAAEPKLIDAAKCAIPFTISTQQEDSDGDVVVSMGADLQDFNGNEVVFFGHQSWQIPIGLSRWKSDPLAVWPGPGTVRGMLYFDQPDPDAMFIYGKVERGILKAASISFTPIDAWKREYDKAHTESTKPLGWVYNRWMLKEWSVVGIGANAEALRDSLDQDKGFITPRLYKSAMRFAAQAKGRCFSGYCPCPPCEEDMSTKLNAATLTSGLPGAKKACHKGNCTCKKCKTKKDLPTESGTEAPAQAAQDQQGTLESTAAAKIPKLIEAGYTEAQAHALAYHLAGEGKEGEDIEGHEPVAMALGYKSKDDGTGEEEMGLKSYLKSIKKDDDKKKPEEDSEEDTTAESETDEPDLDTEDDDTSEEEAPHKPSAKCLGFMHNHMKNAHDYLSKEIPVMDHPQMAKAMTAHCKDLEGHMENYKELLSKHHPDEDMDTLCEDCAKSMGETGESEEVDNGKVPEDETGNEPAAEDKPSPEDKKPTEELMRDYEKPKAGKGIIRKAEPGSVQCVKEAGEYLAEVAQKDDVPKVYRAGMKHYAGELTKVHKSMTTEPVPAKSDEPTEVGKVLNRISEFYFERTGQRL